LIQSLQHVSGFDEKAFIAVHESGDQVTSVRLNPQKDGTANRGEKVRDNPSLLNHATGHLPPAISHLPVTTRVPWSSQGYYLSSRPSFTFDPLFHAGVYYVQEASSMFLEQALLQTTDVSRPLRILDLCAAPGGKSTLLQSLIHKDSLLVCNEVIKSRASVLEENIIKWGAANTVITNNDPSHFARLENYFDVIVVDAPCSGSGLFRRDADAINEWSENNVALCSQRQQRIIADVWPALKQNGILIYSTCSYSAAEDEAIADWAMTALQAESMPLHLPGDWHIIETRSANQAYGYRFYPDKLKGEGFFISVLQKKNGGEFMYPKAGRRALDKPGKTATGLVMTWLNLEKDLILFKQQEDIIALPAVLEKEIPILQSALYIKKAGIATGKLAGNDFIPDHQLALSTLINKNIPEIALNRQEAIQYLRKEDMKISVAQKGWALVSYEGYPLGWIKLLPNRFNNYYPKEWRIIKQAG